MFLRVDIVDKWATPADISKCLRCKSSFITTFLCLKRLGTQIPRDIRRAIAVWCTEPTPSQTKPSILKYYEFYSTHYLTRKYNPYVLGNGTNINVPAIGLLVICGSKSFRARFHHPFEKMLREPSTMFCEIYTLQASGYLSTATPDRVTYDITLPPNGDVIVGIVRPESIIRGCFRLSRHTVTMFYRVDNERDVSAVAYNISSDFEAIERGDTEYIKSLRTGPPRMCSISHGIVPLARREIYYSMVLHLETKTPISTIDFVCGFMNPQFIEMLKDEINMD